MSIFDIQKTDRKTILSLVWLLVTVNYIFCDVVTLMNPQDLKNILSGSVGEITMNEEFLLISAIILEIPFLMIVLSRLLKYGINRWANIIAGLIMTIVQAGSLFMGTSPTLHYIFYSVIEIGCTVFIVWYAWRWEDPMTRQDG